MDDSLRNRAAKSVFWSAVERYSVQGIQFALGLVIARLVLPAEYGLIAMLGIFLAVAQTFVDSGFSNALIQKKKRSEVDYCTVFYFNIVLALVVYVILVLISPWIAGFYNQPSLEIITKLIGLNIVITAFSIVPIARLSVNLDFKAQAKASLISAVVSGSIGISLAYCGYGVWALVTQTLANSCLNTILLWGVTRWRPSWIFSWQSFRELFAFGSKLLASGLLHTIYMNLYSLVIGRKFLAIELGYYSRAYLFASFPSVNMMNIILRAVYPVECELQHEEERLKSLLLQSLRWSCFLVFPLMMGVAILAEPLISFLLTDKWLPAAELLSILCMAYAWYPVMSINSQILNVKGRSDYFLRAEILKKIFGVGILLLTIRSGVSLLCWGIVVYNIVDTGIIIFYVRKVIHLGFREQVRNIFPFILLTAGMGIIIYGSVSGIGSSWGKLAVGSVLGLVAYSLLALLFRFPEIKIVKGFIENYINHLKCMK